MINAKLKGFLPRKELLFFLGGLVLALGSQSNLAILAIAFAVPLYRFYFGGED